MNIHDGVQFNCEWDILYSDARPAVQVYVAELTKAGWESAFDNTDVFIKVFCYK